ncbi:MAG: hypothetical protein F7O42_09245 [Opitutae bacterium]|nr:hypothetical protein [Opitutae bacterium]
MPAHNFYRGDRFVSHHYRVALHWPILPNLQVLAHLHGVDPVLGNRKLQANIAIDPLGLELPEVSGIESIGGGEVFEAVASAIPVGIRPQVCINGFGVWESLVVPV